MHSRRRAASRVAAALALAICAVVGGLAQPGALLVYFGTYTGANSKGIYVSQFNPSTGALTPPVLAAETPNPSFLAVHPTRPFIYAVNEVDSVDGQPGGSVSAFGVDRATGKLRPLNRQASGGRGPAHLSVDRTGRNVLVANYGGGSVAVLPIAEDGTLAPVSAFVQHTGSSVNPERQQRPHAHAIIVDPDNAFAYDVDLGTDTILIHRLNAANGKLTTADPPSASVRAGSGPRHIAIRPDGRFAYVINELLCTITAFRRGQDTGRLDEVETVSTLPIGAQLVKGYSTAEIAVHPSGRFLYGSNRGHDTIAVFALDAASGKLTPVEHEPTQGSTPRGFGITPGGDYLLAANQRSDSVVVFRIDQKTGALTPAGHRITVGSPVSVEFVR